MAKKSTKTPEVKWNTYTVKLEINHDSGEFIDLDVRTGVVARCALDAVNFAHRKAVALYNGQDVNTELVSVERTDEFTYVAE